MSSLGMIVKQDATSPGQGNVSNQAPASDPNAADKTKRWRKRSILHETANKAYDGYLLEKAQKTLPPGQPTTPAVNPFRRQRIYSREMGGKGQPLPSLHQQRLIRGGGGGGGGEGGGDST
ncbi:unnamed protein product, partial [Discosporangium mesarthrocarpum]